MYRGVFVVSLDFEQYWGMRDHVPLAKYKENLLGVREAIPGMLRLFSEFDIHATWATVGFLFCETREELLKSVPSRIPEYRDGRLSPYPDLRSVGRSEEEDPFHFGLSLIRRIAATPGQEIGTHTLSHYYALEEGQTKEDFREDLRMAVCLAERRGLRVKSLVFPRNQVNEAYLPVCRELGITSYRGKYSPAPGSVFRRLSQMDSITPIDQVVRSVPMDIRGSLCFPAEGPSFRRRIYNEATLVRLKSESAAAARRGMLYHVWWHPDDFGIYTHQNLVRLRRLFVHIAKLREKYGMECLNMGEFAQKLQQARSEQ